MTFGVWESDKLGGSLFIRLSDDVQGASANPPAGQGLAKQRLAHVLKQFLFAMGLEKAGFMQNPERMAISSCMVQPLGNGVLFRVSPKQSIHSHAHDCKDTVQHLLAS